MKKLIVLICLVLVASYLGAAEKLQRITMKDDSVIIGKVLGMKDGVYSVESTTLGKLSLMAENVIEIRTLGQDEEQHPPASRAIKEPDSKQIQIRDGSNKKIKRSSAREKYEQSSQKNSPSGSGDLTRQQEEVNSRVKSMTADGNFLNSLMDLSQDSSMMDVMSDPEIMEAISNNDYEFLMNNEKMKSLMDSQDMKNLLGDVEP